MGLLLIRTICATSKRRLLPGNPVTQPGAASLLGKEQRKQSGFMLIPLVPTDFQLTAVGDDDHPTAESRQDASSSSGARVIEFHVPATFQLPQRRWVPPEEPGKLSEFPTRGVRKSA